MKLASADRIEIDKEKVDEYCLNPEHPLGVHKARVFKAALGIDRTTAEQLRLLLRDSVRLEDAVFIREDIFGKHYRIDHEVSGLKGKEILRSFWIVEGEGQPPRFISCYIRKKKP
jgi:hypothetical protein